MLKFDKVTQDILIDRLIEIIREADEKKYPAYILHADLKRELDEYESVLYDEWGEEDVNDLKDKIGDLEADLEEKDGEIDDLEERLTEAEDRIYELSEELEQAKERITELGGEL